MSHWYGEQGTDYDQSYEESNESTAHNNLPLRPGDDGTEHFGEGAECGNVTYAVMLAFNCMQPNAGLSSLTFVRLVCWNGRGGTNDKIAITIVLRAANKCRWRPQLCESRGVCIIIRDRGDHGRWQWQ